MKNLNYGLLLLLAVSTSLLYGQKKGFYEDVDANYKFIRPTDIEPNQSVRPRDFKHVEYPTARELYEKYSEDMMKHATKLMNKVDDINKNGKYKDNWESLDSHPIPEWYLDCKFGMFVDWGLYSIPAYAPKGYPDWYLFRMMKDTKGYHEKYWGKDFRQDDFIQLFTAEDFDADYLAEIAVSAGMKYIIPFLKHHDGYCLWNSSFTMRDSKDMTAKRDIAQEWVDACKKRNLKYGFYYSIDDWSYPIIKENGDLTIRNWNFHRQFTNWADNESDWKGRMIAGKIPVKDFYNEYINPKAIDFFDKYDPDIYWGDGDWIYNWDERNTLPIISYFYNNAEGRKEVVVNDRIGNCRLFPTYLQHRDSTVHGDFVCSEGGYRPGKSNSRNIDRKWEENHGLSHSFGYNWKETDEDVRSAKEVLAMLVDVVADGGNMLLITNLTPTGKLDPLMAARLKEVGNWMKINGEAIYASRKWIKYSDGSDIRFTRSKDNEYIYVFFYKWPKGEIFIEQLHTEPGFEVQMLGSNETIKYKQTKPGMLIKVPESLEKNKPCDHIWVLKVKNGDREGRLTSSDDKVRPPWDTAF